jgi:plasmid stabilization system protein ParE
MGKRKVIWSVKANKKLLEILEFYAQRNRSKTHSIKLYNKLRNELLILTKHPEIGIKTEIESIRGLIVEDYLLFYEFDNGRIIVHSLWDCRQNPDDLNIK